MRTSDYEVRFCELRVSESERTIEGTIVRFDDEASIAGVFRERILPNAFEMRSDMILNQQHDRTKPLAKLDNVAEASFSIRQTASAYEIRARIARTTVGDDALYNIRNGLLSGFSVEMKVHDEDWREEASLRLIKRATMAGVALVDRPAYPQSSVEARQAFLQAGVVDTLRKYPGLNYYV